MDSFYCIPFQMNLSRRLGRNFKCKYRVSTFSFGKFELYTINRINHCHDFYTNLLICIMHLLRLLRFINNLNVPIVQ